MLTFKQNRLGSLVSRTILSVLSHERYQIIYRKIMAEFQSSPPTVIYFQSGRSKVDANFPNIGIEIRSRAEDWAGISYTKDITFEFDIYVAIRNAKGSTKTAEGELNQVDDYIITLAEFTMEALNEPLDALQYTITTDHNGALMENPLKIYDSMVRSISYGHLYNGALRTAKLDWMGKLMRTGPSGGQQGY